MLFNSISSAFLAAAGLMIFIPRIRSELKDNVEFIHPNSRQKSVLQGTMKDLLDFKEAPTRPLYKSSKSRYAAAAFMQGLFKEFQDRHSNEPSVVRSFNPDPETNGHILRFDLKSLQSSVKKGEIHFNLRHRKPRASLKQHTRLRCFAKNRLDEWIQLPMVSLKVSWITFDATEVLNEMLHGNERKPFEVKFLRERRLKPKRALKAEKVLRRNTPFLLVFSDETPQIKQDETLNAFYASETDLDHNRVKRRTDANYYLYKTSDASDTRETHDHRGPQHSPAVIQHVQEFQENGPGVLKSRKKHRRERKKNRKGGFREKSWKERGRSFSDDEPFNVKGMSTEDEDEYNVDKKSNSIIYGSSKDTPAVVLLKEGKLSPASRPCSRRRLSVSFRDIGWGDWVIAPVNFEAFYCTGTCPFPLTKDVNPTNHALIQSMIHAIGIDPYVPALCCAPEKMDSLTLLFYDQDGNIALKNYPKMTVSSCACL